MFALSLISHSLETVLYIVLFLYIQNLERSRCDCSKDWRRTYLKWFFLAMSVYSAVMLFVTIANGQLALPFAHSVAITLVLLVAFTLFIVFAIQYSLKLNKAHCKCANGVSKDLMFVWALALLCITIFTLLSIFSISSSASVSSGGLRRSLVKVGSEVRSSVAHPIDAALRTVSKIGQSLSKAASPKRR